MSSSIAEQSQGRVVQELKSVELSLLHTHSAHYTFCNIVVHEDTSNSMHCQNTIDTCSCCLGMCSRRWASLTLTLRIPKPGGWASVMKRRHLCVDKSQWVIWEKTDRQSYYHFPIHPCRVNKMIGGEALVDWVCSPSLWHSHRSAYFRQYWCPLQRQLHRSPLQQTRTITWITCTDMHAHIVHVECILTIDSRPSFLVWIEDTL